MVYRSPQTPEIQWLTSGQPILQGAGVEMSGFPYPMMSNSVSVSPVMVGKDAISPLLNEVPKIGLLY
jgi:hypothetical protein